MIKPPKHWHLGKGQIQSHWRSFTYEGGFCQCFSTERSVYLQKSVNNKKPFHSHLEALLESTLIGRIKVQCDSAFYSTFVIENGSPWSICRGFSLSGEAVKENEIPRHDHLNALLTFCSVVSLGNGIPEVIIYLLLRFIFVLFYSVVETT